MDNESTIPVDKLVKVYIKMRDHHTTMMQEFKKQEDASVGQMKQVKDALLAYCKDQNLESVKTAEGSFYRTTKRRYTTADWGSMNQFILEHQVPELYEKRIHQGNMETFLTEHPDLLPPGLNCDAEYSVTVRRNKQ
jgi:hypothetical protein